MAFEDAKLKLHFFGSLRVMHDEQGELSFKGRKAKALLAYLLLEAKPHRRDALASLFWSDVPETKARSNLSVALSRLAKGLGESETPYFLSDRQTVQLNPELKLDLDLFEFDRLFLSCQHHDHETRSSCGDCHGRLIRAAELYKGLFLADFYVEAALAFEEWLHIKREEYSLKAVGVFADLANYYENVQHYAAAEAYSRQQLKLEPFLDSAHRRLMRVLCFQSETQRALDHYEACKEFFQLELGFEPERATSALYEQIQMGGLSAPESLDTLPLAPQLPVSLPKLIVAKPNFMGREVELAQLEELLQSSRLVTLLGLGGVGKTELALKLAQRQEKQFAGAIVFVPVEDISDPEVMWYRIAETLGLGTETTQNALQTLINFIANKAMLLILDAAEQLVGGAASFSGLLEHCPQLTMLVTSRESLQIKHEQCLRLKGFPVPESKALIEVKQSYAVQLFVKQAQRHQTDFVLTNSNAATVVKICCLLEGLPLGLELAAVWVSVLPLEEIAHELSSNLDLLKNQQRDAPERHRSIRAVFEHAWQQLEPHEQQIMQSLAVFRGGFRRQAAQAVSGASLSDMARLSHKALLNLQPSNRYGLHALLNQYSLEKLELDNDGFIRSKSSHASYFFSLLSERFNTTLESFSSSDLDILAEEDANLFAAWQCLIKQKDWAALQANLGALSRFFIARSRQKEGLLWLEEAYKAIQLDLESTDLLKLCEANLLVYQALLMMPLGRYEEVSKLAQKGLEDCQKLGLVKESAVACNILGNCELFFGHRVEAEAHFTEGLKRFTSLDQYAGITNSLNNLAIVARRNGKPVKAKQLYEQCLELRREKADLRNIAVTLANLGSLERYAFKNFDVAKDIFLESLDLRREVADVAGEMSTLNMLGGLACDCNDYMKAKPYLEDALEISLRIGHLIGTMMAMNHLGRVALQTNVTEAMKLWSKALRIALELGDLRGQLRSLSWIASSKVQSQPRQAAMWLTVIRNHPSTSNVGQEQVQSVLETLPADVLACLPELQSLEELTEEILRMHPVHEVA